MPKASGGRPDVRQSARRSIAALAREYGIEAIETLVILMRSGTSDNIRADAANKLLDRGFGKATEHVQSVNVDAAFADMTDDELRNIVSILREQVSGGGSSGINAEPEENSGQLH